MADSGGIGTTRKVCLLFLLPFSDRFRYYYIPTTLCDVHVLNAGLVPAGKHRLILCCISTLRWPIVAVIVPRLALLAFTICQPLILNRLLVFLDDTSQSISIGHGLIGAYGLVYIGIALSQALYWHRNARSVTLLRGVLVSAVFSKVTGLSTTATDDSAAVTLMSSDVRAFAILRNRLTCLGRRYSKSRQGDSRILGQHYPTWHSYLASKYSYRIRCFGSHYSFSRCTHCYCPGITTCTQVPDRMAGEDAETSWFVLIPLSLYLYPNSVSGITSAMIGHIKSIKCSGLAQNLSDTILNLRAEEIRASRPFRIVSSVTSAIAQVPLMMSPVAAFALFQGVASNSSETLDATKMFSALSLIILLAQPLFFMFEVILDMSAALGAFERIQKFLVQETRHDRRKIQSGSSSTVSRGVETESVELRMLGETTLPSAGDTDTSSFAVEVSRANIAWSEERTLLQDLSFTVDYSQFALLLGPVASGKSTLLKAILGEVPFTTGTVSLNSERVAWCEQSPWLLVRLLNTYSTILC